MITVKEEFVGGPKYRRAVAAGGSDAITMWLALKCFAAEHLTDGFVPETELVAGLPGAPRRWKKAMAALESCGREQPGGKGAGLVDRAESGWQLHDYLDHASSSDEQQLRREKERLRKSQWRTNQAAELVALKAKNAGDSGKRATGHSESARNVPRDNTGHPGTIDGTSTGHRGTIDGTSTGQHGTIDGTSTGQHGTVPRDSSGGGGAPARVHTRALPGPRGPASQPSPAQPSPAQPSPTQSDPDPDPERVGKSNPESETPKPDELPPIAERSEVWVKDRFGASIRWSPAAQWPEVREVLADCEAEWGAEEPPRNDGDLRVVKIVEAFARGSTRAELREAIRGARHSKYIAQNAEYQRIQTILRDGAQIAKFRSLLNSQPPQVSTHTFDFSANRAPELPNET